MNTYIQLACIYKLNIQSRHVLRPCTDYKLPSFFLHGCVEREREGVPFRYGAPYDRIWYVRPYGTIFPTARTPYKPCSNSLSTFSTYGVQYGPYVRSTENGIENGTGSVRSKRFPFLRVLLEPASSNMGQTKRFHSAQYRKYSRSSSTSYRETIGQ